MKENIPIKNKKLWSKRKIITFTIIIALLLILLVIFFAKLNPNNYSSEKIPQETQSEVVIETNNAPSENIPSLVNRRFSDPAIETLLNMFLMLLVITFVAILFGVVNSIMRSY